jgi:NAD(P)-dependent dehydrogenase (short-subunit alcohol dehydrogenase family)
MFTNDLLSNKRILITGGGTGLGAAMAHRFAELGASLVLCGRRAGPLQETAERIRSACQQPVQTLVCDIRDPDAVEAMFQDIAAQGPLDGLVNNAAATFVAQTERLSPNAVDAVLGATLHGALYCTLAAGRRWIDSGRHGVVLSILSTSVRTGRAFTVPSAVAKSGLQAMTRSLAVEWGGRGIRLVAIAPGPFPTDGTRQQLLVDRRPAVSRNPMGRVGQPPELANLASFLLSDEASFINGETVAIDGGAHLRTSGAEDLLGWSSAQWEAQRASRSRAGKP